MTQSSSINGFSLEVVRMACGEPQHEDINVLNWVRCLGWQESDRKFSDPRTGEKRVVPGGQIHFALTTYHYGKGAVWYFGGSKLPYSVAEYWRNEIKSLAKDEEAIFVVKQRVPTWDPGSIKFISFSEFEFEIPRFESGVRLIESLDRPETVSFVPIELFDDSDCFVSSLFEGYYFNKRFNRSNIYVAAFVPDLG